MYFLGSITSSYGAEPVFLTKSVVMFEEAAFYLELRNTVLCENDVIISHSHPYTKSNVFLIGTSV